MFAQPRRERIKSLVFGFTESSGCKLETMLSVQSGVLSRNLDQMFHSCLLSETCVANPTLEEEEKTCF